MAVLNKRAIVTAIEMYGVTAIRLGRTLNPSLDALIKALFTSGEQGFAYDPNDLTTLYQDAAGTIPVTAAGQPVGLMLDKSKGLTVGAELNATALPKITGNAPVATYNSTTKVGTVNRVDVSNQSFIVLSSAVGGKWYYVSVKNTGLSQIALRNSNNFGVDTTIANISPNGTFIGYVYVATNYVLGIASALGEGTFIVNTVKEIAGNHAYQTVSASRPVLQQTPILGNELVVNGDFSNGLNGWQNVLTTTTVENGRAKVTYTNGGGLSQDIPVTAGKTYKVSSKVENVSGATPALYVYGSAGFSPIIGVSYPSTSALYVTAVASSIRVYLNKTGAGEAYWDDISVKEVTGYRTDQNYLAFDGVDDFLQTNNIDFTATDKVSLFAGVRKLSDSTQSVITELGITQISSFIIHCGGGGGTEAYTFGSRGSDLYSYAILGRASNPSLLAPHSAVLTAKAEISTTAFIKANDKSSINNSNQGTGNYGNYPLYIGRRGGTSLPFNGHLYSLIGIGRLTTGSETIALEKSIAKNVGVTLNV